MLFFCYKVFCGFRALRRAIRKEKSIEGKRKEEKEREKKRRKAEGETEKNILMVLNLRTKKEDVSQHPQRK